MDTLNAADNEKRSNLLKVMLANQIVNQSTDLHISKEGRMMYRCRGNMVLAANWERLTDPKGFLLPEFSFDKVRELLIGEESEIGGVTKVHRGQTTQVRVQGLRTASGDKIFIRVQPLEPPKLVSTLASQMYNPLRTALTNASGLVLVCGPIGSGKTTLAAALVEHWASNRARHIATIEDPTEYLLSPKSGEVSSVNANLLRGLPGKGAAFTEVLRDLLRSDIDGLFIGEARDPSTRNACLDFAATEEPVVTTVHACGLADAILRLTHSEDGRDTASLRHVLSQCLHSIVYVKLAYTSDGKPVPVITALPGHIPAVRNAIATGNPATISTSLSQALAGCEEQGGASGGKALQSATERQATEASAKEALPPEARQQKT